ncbi:DUF3325 domain-containing protein [Methylobacterium gnaphalii]|uniref:Iron uptake protein n=1 Tax=Methylobacterium gnaphalii TaxID=1010610 RepID=A0A512JQZ7_9HYPH|nr:DUF3325 domain-containing protein [Methylobacterium gnaphalii]GEP12375.1 hypothetical protein MGN01_42200 [Methylobacterium gnaphalii]GJD69875.1 hypothetical protein MMMDOFMJ_2814 [Methylobacterium gnaphalii]GLS51438.1 hypothetical protein GCM10007885_42950 [Methylobacterium gnaphalii]
MITSSLALSISLSFAALAALCLSLNRHHSDVLQSKPQDGRVALLRTVGWTGIGLSLILTGYAEGWVFAPVQWIGATSCAGLLLVLLLAYRPRFVPPAAAASLLFSVIGAFLIH